MMKMKIDLIRAAAFLSIGLMFMGQTVLGQWVQQNSTTTTSLQSVSFVDSLNGWISGGSGTILHTTNGGQTWVPQTSNTTATLNSISFCDLNNGWTVGSQGTILRTTDGGNLWTKIVHDTSSRVNHFKVQCLSPLNVVVLRDSFATDYETAYRIWKTTNSGLTWTQISPGPQIYYNKIRDIHFLTPQIGWACGLGDNSQTFLQGCQIHRTTNGGNSWQSYWFNPPGFGWAIGRVFFEDANNGWALDRDTLFRSSDGGVSWYTHSVTSYGFNWAGEFVMKDSIGYAIVGSYIKKTVDKGLTWTQYSTNKLLFDLALSSQNNVWVVGFGGLILHTANGGVTFIQNNVLGNPSSLRLEQNYPNPFNPATNIHYSLSTSGLVKLSILDILGREVGLLINEYKSAGKHEIQWNGSKYPSGIYFAQLSSGNIVETKRMLLIK